jgi:peptidoglycan/xylan/chitin deacetylase (PgdA/CDA1 family)
MTGLPALLALLGTWPGSPGVTLAQPAPVATARSPLPKLAPIRRVETAQPTVALTFDACATRTHASGFDRAVYQVLKQEAVPATIFVSGRWVEVHGPEMTELAADPLIAFGDHSFDHPHMNRIPKARMAQQIDQTEAALARYGKRSVAFRPPFGEWNSRLVEVAKQKGLPTVTWDVVSGDPSAHTTAPRLVRNVLDRTRAGSIVIFHINGRGRKTAEALPEILRSLRDRGLRFVFLSDLLAEPTAQASVTH